jgi:hypothetical protein
VKLAVKLPGIEILQKLKKREINLKKTVGGTGEFSKDTTGG